jgi:hypothetical protein
LRLQVAAEGGLEPGPDKTTGGDGSGGEKPWVVRLVEIRVLTVSVYNVICNVSEGIEKEGVCKR